MARIDLGRGNKLFITLSEFQSKTIKSNKGICSQFIMSQPEYLCDEDGKVMRGCIITDPYHSTDGKEIQIIDVKECRMVPICPEYQKLFTLDETSIYGYPRIPTIHFRAGGKRYVYVLTLDDISELHKHSSIFAAADMDRITLNPTNVKSILRAMMMFCRTPWVSDLSVPKRGSILVGGKYSWRDPRTIEENMLFYIHASKHLANFASVIKAHSVPHCTAIDRKLQPLSIEQFNDMLRRDLSPELFDDLVRTGCVISGSYVLRALTEGQSDFKAADIDIYCTDLMFAGCRALHRQSRTNFISTRPDGYDDPKQDISDIIAIQSYIYAADLPADLPGRDAAIEKLRKSNSLKIQFIILRDDINVTEWIHNRFDISFLTSTWREGAFHITDAKELVTRTGTILPSYVNGLDTMPDRRVWMTMIRIVKYVDRGFRIENVDEFASRVIGWFIRLVFARSAECARSLLSPVQIE